MDTRTGLNEDRYPLLNFERQHDHTYFEQLKRSLRLRLFFVFVIPLLVLSAFFHFQYKRTMREGIDNHLRSIVENRRNTVDLFLRERVANLKNVFSKVEPSNQEAERNLEQALLELKRESSTFVDLGLFREDGVLVAYSGAFPSLVDKNYIAEEWFQQLLGQERDYFISDVYLGFRGKPHFIVAVRRSALERVWILRASVDPQRFGEFVSRSYLLENAEAFIVNDEGQHQTFLNRAHTPKLGRLTTRTAETEVAEVEFDGDEYLRAVAWLTGPEWAMVVRVTKAEAFASMTIARIVLAAIVFMALATITFVIMGFSKKLVDRLEDADQTKNSLREQLCNAAKLASVGEIAAGVAHEINNPLAIIYEEAAMMLDIMDPKFHEQMKLEEFGERLQAIKDATMRGRSITQKLLAFSRRHESDPKATNLNVLIQKVLEVKSLDFSVSNIRVSLTLAPNLPEVLVNRNQMDQVILNLLNNAKDAIESNGSISIRTSLQGSLVRLEIEDSGGGMEAAVMDRVFFPFFTTKPVGKGTGLGLSISYGIIKSFGGWIEVSSVTGQGTTFTILLPVPDPAAADPARDSQLAGGGYVGQ